MSRRGFIAGKVTASIDEISAEVAALRTFSLADLRYHWRGLGGGPLPKSLPPFLVFRLWPASCKRGTRATSVPTCERH